MDEIARYATGAIPQSSGCLSAAEGREYRVINGDNQGIIRPQPGQRRMVYGAIYLVILAVTAILSACSDKSAPGSVGAGSFPDWQPIFRGVDHAALSVTDPRPLKLNAIRVDLSDPTIRFFATPSLGAGRNQVRSLKTSTFLEKYQCQVAINATPFGPVGDKEGLSQFIAGLAISEGMRYAPPAAQQAALLITKDNTAWIGTPPFDTSQTWNAVGGYELVLRHGRNVGDKQDIHPRTAVGLSHDGRRLFLLVLDGRQPNYSEGATNAQTADWLARLGAYSGMTLDGGGSTAMVIADAQGHAQVLNCPIHKGIPGTERPVANHLGIYAQPLKQ